MLGSFPKYKHLCSRLFDPIVFLLKFGRRSQKVEYSYRFAYWAYGRCLGLITLIAFLSYWHQADALIGPEGLKPWKKDLLMVESLPIVSDEESQKWILRPTLLWLEPFANHHLLFLIGSISAIALSIGIFPPVSAFLCYLIYLSLMVVGEPFLSFQWDALLTETLLLSLFFLPFTKFHKLSDHLAISSVGRLLIVSLLAKLMIESGIVKFTFFAGDGSNTWRDFTALDFHYWTQPLPHPLSPWVHALAPWFDQLSLLFMYCAEVILPLFLFLPGRFRRVGLLGQVILQFAILASGNYGFFNLLTLCLCIPLIDDQLIPGLKKGNLKNQESPKVPLVSLIPVSVVFTLFFITTYGHLVQDLKGNQKQSDKSTFQPSWLKEINNHSRTLRCFNSYGLFRVMTITRPEIIIEGSLDGKNWEPYEFKWKPSHANQALRFTGPHMPRLDWQMWFEGLNFENYVKHPFPRFLYGRFLLMKSQGEPNSVFADLPRVLGTKEFQSLRKASPSVQNQALANYNNLIQTFISRSEWFGNFLQAIAEQKEPVLSLLSSKSKENKVPNFLKVSLCYFEFSEENSAVWKITEIPDATYVLNLNKEN